MAKIPLDITVRDRKGNVIPGSPVHVYDFGTTSEVQLYEDQAGTLPADQPILADANGQVLQADGESPFWVEAALFTLKWVDGATPKTRPFLPSGISDFDTAISSFMATMLDDPNAATARTTIDAQQQDDELDELAGMSTAAATAVAGITAAAVQNFLTAADAAAARAAIGAGTGVGGSPADGIGFFVNAKTPPTGYTPCAGNGTTDDRAAAQALIDDFQAVYFPAGSYKIMPSAGNGLRIPDGRFILGAGSGVGGTLFLPGAGMNTLMGNVDFTNGASDVIVQGIYFYGGGGLLQRALDCCLGFKADATIGAFSERIYVKDCRVTGSFNIPSSGAGEGIKFNSVHNGVIEGCEVSYTHQDGIQCNGDNENVVIRRNVVWACGDDYIALNNGNASNVYPDRVVIVDNILGRDTDETMRGSGNAVGIRGGKELVVAHNICSFNWSNGILASTGDAQSAPLEQVIIDANMIKGTGSDYFVFAGHVGADLTLITSMAAEDGQNIKGLGGSLSPTVPTNITVKTGALSNSKVCGDGTSTYEPRADVTQIKLTTALAGGFANQDVTIMPGHSDGHGIAVSVQTDSVDNIRRVTVSNNRIQQTKADAIYVTSNATQTIRDILIHNNSCHWSQPMDAWSNATASGVFLDFTSANKEFHTIRIDDNVIRNAPGVGINAPTPQTSNGGGRCRSLKVRRNTVFCSGVTTASPGIYITWVEGLDCSWNHSANPESVGSPTYAIRIIDCRGTVRIIGNDPSVAGATGNNNVGGNTPGAGDPPILATFAVAGRPSILQMALNVASPNQAPVTIASAATITIPDGVKFAELSGTTSISTIHDCNGGDGFFEQEVTLKVNAGPISILETGNIRLAGALTGMDTNDNVTLISNGTVWIEKCRSGNV